MATANYNPNAVYDQGQNAAGSNGVPPNVATDSLINVGLSAARNPGLMTDYTLADAHYRTGFSAAGHRRDNSGPNVAGTNRGIGTTTTAH